MLPLCQSESHATYIGEAGHYRSTQDFSITTCSRGGLVSDITELLEVTIPVQAWPFSCNDTRLLELNESSVAPYSACFSCHATHSWHLGAAFCPSVLIRSTDTAAAATVIKHPHVLFPQSTLAPESSLAFSSLAFASCVTNSNYNVCIMIP